MSKGTPAKVGDFCWNEIVTKDLQGAMAFYSQLFGWTMESVPGSLGGYQLLKVGEDMVGGLYELTPELRAQGVPPHWLNYVRVENVNATAIQVKEMGGDIVAGPMEVKDVGRMLVFRDNEGAMLAAWQVVKHAGSTIHGEVHSLCWMELMAHDAQSTSEFYSTLFDWKAKALEGMDFPYIEFYNGEMPQAGLMVMEGRQWSDIPPHWMAYIRVEDVDTSAAKAKELGGMICVPPTNIPNVGRFAVLDDPQGATFAVFKFAMAM